MVPDVWLVRLFLPIVAGVDIDAVVAVVEVVVLTPPKLLPHISLGFLFPIEAEKVKAARYYQVSSCTTMVSLFTTMYHCVPSSATWYHYTSSGTS